MAVHVETDEHGVILTPVEAAERQERREHRNALRKELGLDGLLEQIQKNTEAIKSLTDSIQREYQRIY
ncbi:hypothetical protein ASU33_13895 [Solirubrum puertoriconensis]|uniref:Uncharacterized protein n=1 Tax=Solirubrum puertoriconensis TaxID=1751427 RepID=A0A9X0HK39_SOLP1|nr:hypothetical protein ASU33_13895 [Solirubrum puertoriconensis]